MYLTYYLNFLLAGLMTGVLVYWKYIAYKLLKADSAEKASVEVVDVVVYVILFAATCYMWYAAIATYSDVTKIMH